MNAFPTPSHSYTASVKTATQSSIVSGSTSRRSSCSTSRRGVEHPHYRSTNLADHSITFREYYEEIPESLRPLLDRVREDRGSPTPSLDVVELAKLETDPHEDTVEEYFKKDVFPLKWGPTRRDSKLLMHREDLPEKTNFQSDLTLTQPKPDIVYGLSRNEAFPQHVSHLSLLGNYMIANTRDLLWPFFVIEMKADGPGKSGSLYTATNQCLNASSSCVNIREKLASQLKYSNSADVNMPDTAAFAIAMSGTEARLYICWKERLEYRMQRVSAYLLQRPSDYEGFRKHVRNILDWGSTERLQTILRGLDSLAQSCGDQKPRHLTFNFDGDQELICRLLGVFEDVPEFETAKIRGPEEHLQEVEELRETLLMRKKRKIGAGFLDEISMGSKIVRR
ncbi:hypothetical protein EJ04DRAFT_582396 [Polyplosphaeria fusca]|uniref:DUF7924 domain-containing protein n=1 Tax=Polyplosphaeria fusca TaxID=682080 RepID=A0A9P4QLG5_9PLEO|nr:hypothetical protein EJ04DRAFT_582396 [Polyplosphaeria fusca]